MEWSDLLVLTCSVNSLMTSLLKVLRRSVLVSSCIMLKIVCLCVRALQREGDGSKRAECTCPHIQKTTKNQNNKNWYFICTNSFLWFFIALALLIRLTWFICRSHSFLFEFTRNHTLPCDCMRTFVMPNTFHRDGVMRTIRDDTWIIIISMMVWWLALAFVLKVEGSTPFSIHNIRFHFSCFTFRLYLWLMKFIVCFRCHKLQRVAFSPSVSLADLGTIQRREQVQEQKRERGSRTHFHINFVCCLWLVSVVYAPSVRIRISK